MREDHLRHNPSIGRILEIYPQASIVAENVGVAYSIDSMFDAFMESPGHRDNILNTVFKYVGIGCSIEEDGRYWIAVVFWG